jgi:hypothetical protein
MLIVPETELVVGVAAELVDDLDLLPQPAAIAASSATVAIAAGR